MDKSKKSSRKINSKKVSSKKTKVASYSSDNKREKTKNKNFVCKIKDYFSLIRKNPKKSFG